MEVFVIFQEKSKKEKILKNINKLNQLLKDEEMNLDESPSTSLRSSFEEVIGPQMHDFNNFSVKDYRSHRDQSPVIVICYYSFYLRG